MVLPNFLGIGAQKAGTTWIAHNLRINPEIFIPPLQEIHYFDRFSKYPSPNLPDSIFERIFREDRWWRNQWARFLKAKHLKDKAWFFKYLFGNYNNKWYASLFNAGKGKVCGEITPAYSILNPEDIKKIHQLMPNIKIIFMLRNPIERAWSQLKNDANIAKKSLSSYSDEELKNYFNSSAVRLRGDYLKTLKNWQKFFHQKQFFIGFLDEIVQDPKGLMLRLYRFLELKDPKTCIERIYPGKINPSSEVKLPRKYKDYLIQIYHREISELAKKFPGYPSSWLKEIR